MSRSLFFFKMIRNCLSLFDRCLAKTLDPCLSIFDCCLKLLGPCLVGFASCLFSFVTYTYFAEVLPVLQIHYGHTHATIITLFGIWLDINLFFNYYSASLVGPGHPPATFEEARLIQLASDPELDEGMLYRFCRKCNCVKPMRTHHCSICKRCVLKMDHHCPWINNCVGWKNHKHFILFLAYLCSGSLFFLVTSADLAVRALSGYNTSFQYTLSAVLCMSAFLATGMFLLWSLYLLATNQTTIEFYDAACTKEKSRMRVRKPFDLGVMANFRSVFGNKSIPYWFTPNHELPQGDGLIYPLRQGAASNAAERALLVV